jgi:Methane oxygenase PmoA
MPDASVPALRVKTGADAVEVFRAGVDAPILTQHAQRDHRPFIHPITVPGGAAIVTEDAPGHHPWQHGLYIGLNDVNGIGFWAEGLQAKRAADDGTFHPVLVEPATAEGNRASWAVRTEYRSRGGEPVLDERQDWELADLGDRYELDLVWTLTALTDVTFGEYEYGGLFLRMPYRSEQGGTAHNSEGQIGSAAEGQRARWVSTQMPIDDEADEVMAVVMDHPANLEHPVPWRVDNELGIGPSPSIAGSWSLPAGGSQVFHYRVAIFAAPADDSTIERNWASFSGKAVE